MLIKMEIHSYLGILGKVLLILHMSSVCGGGAFLTYYNPCRPIRGPSGEMIRTVPKTMHSFPIPNQDIRQHLVCVPEADARSSITADPSTKTNASITADPTSATDPSTVTDSMTATHPTSLNAVTTSDLMKEPSLKIFVTDRGSSLTFVADLPEHGEELVFDTIPCTGNPRYITYDSESKRIYWSDYTDKEVYRADVNGSSREGVTHDNSELPYGIAISKMLRTLFIAYPNSNKISSVSIEQSSGTKNDFIRNIDQPRALVIDEEQGYLYWTMRYRIARSVLSGQREIEEIYYNRDLSGLTGLSIDFTGDVRRVFFSDFRKNRIFYKDVNTPLDRNATSVQELTDYMHDQSKGILHSVNYFNGVLYLVKTEYPQGLVLIRDYNHPNRSYSIQEIDRSVTPVHMQIAFIES